MLLYVGDIMHEILLLWLWLKNSRLGLNMKQRSEMRGHGPSIISDLMPWVCWCVSRNTPLSRRSLINCIGFIWESWDSSPGPTAWGETWDLNIERFPNQISNLEASQYIGTNSYGLRDDVRLGSNHTVQYLIWKCLQQMWGVMSLWILTSDVIIAIIPLHD